MNFSLVQSSLPGELVSSRRFRGNAPGPERPAGLGSCADRARLGVFVVFVVAWSLLVYAPLAHWVFSPDGWLARRGVEDFAGGTVVEINSGFSGVALALVIGRRRGWPRELMRPHNVPLSVLGAGILWFGWFGFNAGSALSAGRAGTAFVNTNTATAAALLGHEALAIAVTVGWAFGATAIVALAVHKTMGLRVSVDTEIAGLDISLHEQTAYDFEALSTGARGSSSTAGD